MDVKHFFESGFVLCFIVMVPFGVSEGSGHQSKGEFTTCFMSTTLSLLWSSSSPSSSSSSAALCHLKEGSFGHQSGSELTRCLMSRHSPAPINVSYSTSLHHQTDDNDQLGKKMLFLAGAGPWNNAPSSIPWSLFWSTNYCWRWWSFSKWTEPDTQLRNHYTRIERKKGRNSLEFWFSFSVYSPSLIVILLT